MDEVVDEVANANPLESTRIHSNPLETTGNDRKTTDERSNRDINHIYRDQLSVHQVALRNKVNWAGNNPFGIRRLWSAHHLP